MAGLTNLTQLQIGNNTISDITSVQNLTNLEWLDMPNNRISDISAVQNLTRLVELYFQNNAVSDLSPLVANTGFGEYTELDASGNPLSYPSIYTHIPALQAKDVYIDFDNRVATAPVKISGDTQQGNTGTALTQPFVVEVQDGSSVAFEGVPVTFAVTAGDGTLSATSATTDVNGRALSTLTLGNTAGTNTVRVSVQGVSQTITFTATATTTPVVSVSPIINRTSQVRDAIVAALPGVNSANDVTEAHLSTIRFLNLRNKGISTLKTGDFDRLTALTELRLHENQLRTLPANIFSDLSSLKTLYLDKNQLTTLPSGAFNGLTAMTNLYLNNNQLTSLPQNLFSGLSSLTQINLHSNRLTNLHPNVFSGLPSLTQLFLHNNRLASLPQDVFSGLSKLLYLYLHGNQLTSLPAGVFSGLSSLQQLLLNGNQLSVLPAGIFRGLTGLTMLRLQGNSVDPMPLTVSLEKVGANQFKATAPAGAPFTIILPISVANGSISGGATTLTIPQGEVESASLTATRTVGTTDAVTVDFGTLPGLPAQHQGYQLVKSADLPLTIINALRNSAPVFTDGINITRTIAENTAAGINIGTPVTATDVENDTLTYMLSGADSTSFAIVNTTGQLKTQATLDYETKSVYTVTITVSDGSLTDTITVTINIIDIVEQPTETGVCKVGDILAPGESCTYPDTDAVFSVLDDGKSQWHIPNLPSWLQFLNKVSIGGSMSISTTVNSVDYHFVAKSVSNNSWEIEEIGDDTSQPVTPVTPDPSEDTGGTPTLSVSATPPLTEATLHGGIITLNLSGGTFERSTFSIRNGITLSGISGVTVDTFGVDRVSDTQATVELEYDGNMTANGTLTVSVEAGAIQDYDGTALTSQISVPAVTESVTASTATPLTEATLDESVVTLTLSGRKFKSRSSTIRSAVSVSGITGVTVRSFDIDRESDTEVTVELTFDGNLTTDGTLTLTVGADAIAGYNGPALTAQVSVSASTETPVAPGDDLPEVTPDDRTTFESSTPPGYTRVTLRKTGTVWGIPTKYTTDSDVGTVAYMVLAKLLGCNFADAEANRHSIVYIKRESLGRLDNFASETLCGKTSSTWSSAWNAVRITHLRFYDANNSPNIKEAIYNPVTGQIEIPGVWQPPQDTGDTQQPVTPQQPDNTGGTPTLSITTTTPLTEATLHEAVVTLRLSGGAYESDAFDIKRSLTVSGITGADFGSFSVVRVSDTEATVELEFDGNISTNGTLTFSLRSDAIANYDGAALTSQISVRAVTESVTASTAAPLTEATLDESVVTLTLSGRKFESRSSTIRSAVSVSGIAGVTVRSFDIDRVSDTVVTVELTFNGNINTDSTLTFTVGEDSIAGYSGPSLTTRVSVSADNTPVDTGGTPSLSISTVSALTEATLHEAVATLSLSGGAYESTAFDIKRSLTVSGITGADFGSFSVVRVSDTEATVELEFDGNISTNGTLTFSLRSDAIANYDGAALTSQISVRAVTESVTASTAAPLTEATLDESVVTLTLSGRKFEEWNSRIRNGISVSGITGVTVRSFDIDRVSDTVVTVELTFNGNINTDSTLTFTVGADSIAGYSGPSLTTRVSVSASDDPVTGGGTPTLSISTASTLTEATLHEAVVTLRLSSGAYESTAFDIKRSLTVSGITGADFGPFSVVRVSDTEATVELEFDGNISTNGTLTFSLRSDAIANYDGTALTSQISVTAVAESITASTAAPLTETTLSGSVVTLTLSGRVYDSWRYDIERALTISGIEGVTVSSVRRVSNTKVTVILTFSGNIDADSTLTITVGAGAIVNYNEAFTVQLPVTAVAESLVASTDAPLTEATLSGSVVTLTLSGA